MEKRYIKVANLLQEEEQPGGAPFPVSKEGVSPSSVPASAGNSAPGGAPFPEEFAPSSTSQTSMPSEAPTLADAHIEDMDLNRDMISYPYGRGFDNYTE